MAKLGFDASAVEPLQGYQVLPAGRYLVQIVASEMRVTRNGQGQYLWLELDVLEGACAGRKLFDQLNLVNANPQTVEIAQRTLSAICHAVGKLQVQDSEELHLVPMLVDVKVEPPKNGYGESNKIRYLPREDAPAQPARAAAAPRQPGVQPAAPASSAAGAVRPTTAPATAAMQPAARPVAPWKRAV